MGSLLLAIASVHLATIRSGHGWLDDFASYVSHAENIVAGNAYEDTGYVYNPDAPVAGPRAYPPGYPILLAPLVALRGLDLEAMKALGVLFLVLFLAAAYALIRRWHPRGTAVAAIALVGFSPFMSGFKDNVLSDLPFACFMTGALVAMTRDRAARPWLHAAITGVLIYAAYATRSIGLILIPVFGAYAILWNPRARSLFLRSTSIAGGFVAIQGLLVPGGSGYLDQLRLVRPKLVLTNLWRYVQSLEGLTVNGYSGAGGRALMYITIAFALAGYAAKLSKQRRTIVEILVPAYVLTVAAWPSFQSLRFLLPLLPFFFMYAIEGFAWATRTLSHRHRIAAFTVAASIFAASFLGVYTRLDYGPLPDGVATPETQALFDFVRTETPPDAVMLFQRPKALALYTDRAATPYPAEWSDEQIIGYIDRAQITHLVDADFDGRRLELLAMRNPSLADLIFDNGGHRVWRLR